MFLRVIAPHFVAGIEFSNSTGEPVKFAPILHYMKNWRIEKAVKYCNNKNWQIEILHERKKL